MKNSTDVGPNYQDSRGVRTVNHPLSSFSQKVTKKFRAKTPKVVAMFFPQAKTYDRTKVTGEFKTELSRTVMVYVH